MSTQVVFGIDSRDRDVAKYPSPNRYVVDLPETLNNVHSIELVYAHVDLVENDKKKMKQSLTLFVEEAEGASSLSSDASLHGYFTQLPVLNGRVRYLARDAFRSAARAKSGRVSRLSIRFADAGVLDHFLRFEIDLLRPVGLRATESAGSPAADAKRSGTASEEAETPTNARRSGVLLWLGAAVLLALAAAAACLLVRQNGPVEASLTETYIRPVHQARVGGAASTPSKRFFESVGSPSQKLPSC
jgi:hypothetical protein